MSCVYRILVVDDETSVLNAVSRSLHDTSYDVLTACSGREALTILQQQGAVDLVLSDFRMPGMNGVELLQQVMALWPDTKRVILSAYTDSETLLAAVNEGRVHRFLTKPWDNQQLLSDIRALLEEKNVIEKVRDEVEALVQRNQLLAETNDKLQILLSELLKTVRSENSARLHADIGLELQAGQDAMMALSKREQQILLRLAKGQRPKEIAVDLKINIKTVSTYKLRLFAKLGFSNDSDLIGFAIRHRLIGI